MKLFDLDSWQETAAVLGKHPLRTALTALGVILGIFILLAMVGFGRAFESGVKKQMAGFAANAVFVWGQSTTKAYSGLPPDRPIRFNNRDIAAIAALEGVEHVAPRNQRGGFMGGSNVRYGTKTGGFQVAGDYPAWQYVQIPMMRAGRYLNDADLAERRKICVIGEGVAEQLMPGANPIGKHVEISGVYFEIVGVLGTRSTGGQADRILNTVHIPFTTFQQAFNVGDQVGWFAITGRSSISAEELESQIRTALAKNHRFDPTDEEAIGSFNTGREFRKMTSLFSIINMVLWFAGIMTLGAGVVGVSNIMLISVRERTKEFGVRKALGANPREIIRMVVVEALTLTLAAGYLGVVLGIGVLELADLVVIPKLGPKVPLGSPDVGLGLAFGAMGVLALFGMLAGIVPAYHAASIQPVEALRTE
jgi:putative ABC transport system permease protein